MDEKDIQQSLKAIREAGAEVNASPESSRRFLQELGLLGEDGHLKPQFRDYVPPIHHTPQPDSGVSRL